MTYRTTVGITVFGQPSGYSASALTSEFKTFIETNSQLNVVTVTQSIQPALSDAEFFTWNGGVSYFLTPWSLSDANKQKLPPDVQCNIVLYDYKGKPPAFGGGTWGGEYGVNNVPFVAIPLGAWPWADLVPCGGWAIGQTGALVHEWLHAMDWIFLQVGYPLFPSSDNCGDYGFTDSNDPCWTNCYKYLLSLIAAPMYASLENWHRLAWISPSNITIDTNTTQQFAAMDIYNNDITVGTTWTKQSGSGSISTTGLYSAASTDSNAIIMATRSGINVTTSITVMHVQETGGITVTTNVAGATFTLIGPGTIRYYGGGTYWTKTDAVIGTYTVVFNTLTDYTEPTQKTATVSVGYTVSVEGIYIRKKGQLTVDTTPIQGPILLNGVQYGTGHYSALLDTANYMISFGTMSGYTTPNQRTVTLTTAGASTVGIYVPISTVGTLSATTNRSDATFTVTGPATYSGSGTYWSHTNAPTGTYSITFNTISGYTTPTDTPKTLSSGGTASFSGTYVPISTVGTLVVTTNQSGATFTITGPATYSGSGTYWTNTNAPAGTYSITFNPISGHTTPTDSPKTLSSGGTASFSGIYTPITGCTIGLYVDKTSVSIGDILDFTITTTPELLTFDVELYQNGSYMTSVTNCEHNCIKQWDTAGLTAGQYNIQAKITTPTQCESSIITVTLTGAQTESMGGGAEIILIAGLGITALISMKSPIKS